MKPKKQKLAPLLPVCAACGTFLTLSKSLSSNPYNISKLYTLVGWRHVGTLGDWVCPRCQVRDAK